MGKKITLDFNEVLTLLVQYLENVPAKKSKPNRKLNHKPKYKGVL